MIHAIGIFISKSIKNAQHIKGAIIYFLKSTSYTASHLQVNPQIALLYYQTKLAFQWGFASGY